MLVLTFAVGECRYAIDVARVIEVVPRVPLRPLPHTPEYLGGLFNLGGALVPVVDLGLRLGGNACRPLLSTRIIIVRDRGGQPLGLIAEQVTELRAAPEELFASGENAAELDEANPYLGAILPLDGELVQAIRVEEILPDSLREALYAGILPARP